MAAAASLLQLCAKVILVTSALRSARGAKLIAIGGWPGGVNNTKTAEAYDFDTRSWSPIADMPTENSFFGATALNGLIYAVGGPTLHQALVYDPATNAWNFTSDMTVSRMGPGVTTFNGKVYAIGGAYPVFNTVETLNPKVGNTWTLESSKLSSYREYMGVGVVGNEIYAFGGENENYDQVNTAEKYDPKKDAWTPVAPMNNVRRFLCAAVVGDKLYAIGGDGYKSVEVYDPKMNTWSPVADMSTEREGCGAVTYNGIIYVVGGFQLNTMEAYDPQKNTWTLLPARMSTPRMWFGVALLQ